MDEIIKGRRLISATAHGSGFPEEDSSDNQDSKHRTYVYVLTVTETLEDWEDSVNIGRKRKWFKIDEAIRVLQCHKPVHAEYLHRLTPRCGSTNGNNQEPTGQDDNTNLHQTTSHDCSLPRFHR